LTRTKSARGEGPFWHENEFFGIDIIGRKLNKITNGGNETSICDTPSMVGCAVVGDDNYFYLALEDGLYRYINNAYQRVSNMEILDSSLRFNDGKCDARGRLWVGTMDKVNEKEPIGSLYVFDGLQSVKEILTDVIVSNGMCWNIDETKFYYIDSPSRKIVSFDYDPIKLELSNPKTIFMITNDAFPDGMTIDEEGMLWVALWNGYSVIRIDPNSGDVLETVDIPCKKVTSVCFGGEHLDELYITTASLEMSENDWERYPNSGCCFKYHPGVKGFLSNTFCVE
jgi:sugar lactone lactonase YvrE